MIAYKPNASETIKRLKELADRKAQDKIFALFRTKTHAMKDFISRYGNSFEVEYPDPHERMRFWDELLKERSSVEDDSIPYAYPSEFDQGLYGGLLGGDVRFLCMAQEGGNTSGWISSMVPPLLKDWSEFSSLCFDENHPWYERYIRQLKIMSEAAKGKYGISHFTLIDSLNFVYELVGATNTYISLLDYPEMVKKAVDFAFDLNVRIHRAFFDIVTDVSGGTCSWVLPWLSGKILCESVDPFHMMSPEDFEKWGFEPIVRIFEKFDGGVLHLHGNGRHLLESVSQLPKLKAIYLGDDSKEWPAAISIIETLKKRVRDIPLTVNVNYLDFVKRLDDHSLPGGVFYNVYGDMNVYDANKCMEKVRSYRI